ncbi:hypothetical protein Tco_0289291, partial [Tanacetum coccineum]
TQKPKTVYESVNRDKVIIEDWNSDDEDGVSKVQIVCHVKTNETQTVKTRVDKIGQTSQKQGIRFKKIKACFVCKSTDHLNYLSVRRYVADPDNAYPKRSITKLILKRAVIFDVVSYHSESSDFSPTPPPKAFDKGKGIASEDDQLKQLMPFMEQSGSVLKISNHHQFNAAGKGPLSIEKAKAQMEEIKRLADLKAEKEKSKKWLKKVTTPDELRAHAEQLAAYEAKKGKDEKKAGLKRMRKAELIHKVFVKEDIIVDGMHKKLVPPLGVIASEGCIQVKDIVKEVEDYLKTYSSAGISAGL